jgi:hypothetical protein
MISNIGSVPLAIIGREYPYLAIQLDDVSRGRIVLFYAPKCGIVLHDPSGESPVGENATNWAEDDGFGVYDGSVTVSND